MKEILQEQQQQGKTLAIVSLVLMGCLLTATTLYLCFL